MKPGDKVIYVGPHVVPKFGSREEYPLRGTEAVIVAVNDPATHPGKLIALCFKQQHAGFHSCDGLVPHGHGRWSIEDRLATPEQYAKLLEYEKAQVAAVDAANPIVREYLGL